MVIANNDRTAELCAFIAGLEFQSIPQRVVERAKDFVLDHLGVALHSTHLQWTQIVREYAQAAAGGESTVYGSGTKTSRRNAALVNGTAAHGIELDDTHNESFSHPGTVVIPAAFAVAEALSASGRDFLTAVVAGYEALCRAGSAATAAMSRGFHGTAVSGVFGAAAAAGRLLGLPSHGLESAFGLGVSMASGVMQFSEDPEGNMVKRLHGGLPAHNGIMAAELASAGLLGPRQALDGRFGFVRIFGGSQDATRLTRELGSAWEIDQISIKLYACCRMFHAFIDAIRECQANGGIGPEDIATAEVLVPQASLEGRMQYRPRSVMAAQYSLPYAVAATLLLDPQDPRSFDTEVMERRDVRQLMDRVKGCATPELDKLLPEKYPGGIRFTLKDGRLAERTLFDSVGTPERPLDREGIVCKFQSLTSGVVDRPTQEAIIEATFELDNADDVSRLMALVRKPVAAA